MESMKAGTKWFKKSKANLVKNYLDEKGIKTRIVKTTKINPLSGKKKPAYLVKRV